MGSSNTNFRLYTQVNLDCGQALKVGKSLGLVLKEINDQVTKNDELLKKMAKAGSGYSESEIKAQREKLKTLRGMQTAQHKAVQQQISDLNMLRKAQTELDNMSLRQMNTATRQGKKLMQSLGGDKHSQKELQATKELLDLIAARTKSVELGFKNAFESARSGAYMSMKAMEDVIALLSKEGSTIAKNEAEFKKIQETIVDVQTRLASRKGFNKIDDFFGGKSKGKNVTDAQLEAYRKFYDGIANSAMSSAKQVADAMKRVEKANAEITKREVAKTTTTGKGVLDSLDMPRTVQETEEAIKKLKEFKATLSTSDPSAIIEVDKAIDKLGKDLEKAKNVAKEVDGKKLLENVLSGGFSGSVKETEDAIAKLKEYKGFLKSTDTKGITDVNNAIDLLGKKISQTTIDFKKLWETASTSNGINRMNAQELEKFIALVDKEGKSMATTGAEYNKMLRYKQEAKVLLAEKDKTLGIGNITAALQNGGSGKSFTDAQLDNYKKFYEGIANSAESSSERVKIANERIAKVNEIIKQRQTEKVQREGQDTLDNFFSMDNKSIQSYNEALSRLKAYRETIDAMDATNLNKIDDAIKRINDDLTKVKQDNLKSEGGTIVELVNGGAGSMSFKETEEAINKLKEYRQLLKTDDTEGIKKVDEAIKRLTDSTTNLRARYEVLKKAADDTFSDTQNKDIEAFIAFIDKEGLAVAKNAEEYEKLQRERREALNVLAGNKGFGKIKDAVKYGDATKPQLEEYKKFYEGIAKSAMSSAEDIEEANKKIARAQKIIESREQGEKDRLLYSDAQEIMSRAQFGAFGSIEDMEKAIAKLQEYRKAWGDADSPEGEENLEKVDAAINKLRTDLDKTKESTILAKTELKNMFTQTTNPNGGVNDAFNSEALSGKSLVQLKKLREAMQEYKQTINTSTDTGVKELEKVQKALVEIDKAEAKVKASAIDLNSFRGSNLQTKSLAELKQAYKVLEEELQHVAHNQAEWNSKAAQMKEIDGMIRTINSEIHEQTSFWDKAGKKLASYVGVYLSFNAVMNKISTEWRNIVKLSDQMTNVQKVTNLTSSEIYGMTNAIQQLDTRATTTELMDLAEQAGKLGIAAQGGADAIVQFVKAGQQVTNTLGEDLGGAKAVSDLLKVNDLINKQSEGIEQDLMRIGSAILNVGNNSKASYADVSNFTIRMGAIGSVTKTSMTDIMAMGGTFSSLGANIDNASTAMTRILLALNNNTDAIARSVNLTTSEIREMISQGKTMEVLEQVLYKVREQGAEGMDKFLKAVGGKNSSEAKKSVLLLADNIATLHHQSILAEEGFKDGTLVTQEFDKANDNLAGTLQRVSNEFSEVFANATSAKFWEAPAKGLLTLIRFFSRSAIGAALFVGALVSVTASSLKVALSFDAVKKSLVTFRTTMLTFSSPVTKLVAVFGNLISVLWKGKAGLEAVKTSLHALKLAIASNPIGMLVTVLAAAAAAMWNLASASKEAAERATELLEESNKEVDGVNYLKRAIAEANDNRKEQAKLIDMFNKKHGAYIGALINEKNAVERLATAYHLAVAAIKEKNAMQIKQEGRGKALEGNREDINDAIAGMRDTLSGGSWTSNIGKNSFSAEEVEVIISEIGEAVEEQIGKGETSVGRIYDYVYKTVGGKHKIPGRDGNIISQMRTWGGLVNGGRVKDYIKAMLNVEDATKTSEAMSSVESKSSQQSYYQGMNSLISEIDKAWGSYMKGDKSVSEKDLMDNLNTFFSVFEKLEKKWPFEGKVPQMRARLEKLSKNSRVYGENGNTYETMDSKTLADLIDRLEEANKIFRPGTDLKSIYPELELPASMSNWSVEGFSKWAHGEATKIRELLKKRNLDRKGNFQWREEGSGKDRTADYIMDGAMKRLDEYYKRQEERINMMATTEAERQREIVKNEKEHLEERINLQKKFFDMSQKFDHDYITELFNDIDKGDWAKVNTFLADRKNMGKAEGVRLNMAKDANKIQTDANAAQKKIDEVLKGENPFTKLFSQTQSELDILNILLPGVGRTADGDAKTLEQDIDDKMAFLFKAVKEGYTKNFYMFKRAMIGDSETSFDWAAGLTDEQIELLRKRIVEFSRIYNKEIRKAAKDLKQRIQTEWEEDGNEKKYIEQEGEISRQKQSNERLNNLTGASNVWKPNIEDDQELLLYDLKIQKSNELIEQFRKEQQARIDNASTAEEKAREQKIMEQGIAEYQDEIAKLTQDKAEAQADLAYRMIEKFKPYAEMVEQFGEDFGGAIFGEKEERQKAAKALLSSFIKTTGELIKQKLIYITTSSLMEKTQAASSITTNAHTAIANAEISAAEGSAKTIGQMGIWGIAASAAIGVAISGIIAAILAALNKGKSELGVSTGKLTTGMLTYAEGRYPTYGDGSVGSRVNVQGNDGKTYNATYKPRLTTGEYNRPHLGIVGENGAELIIDAPTYKLLRRNAPGILQGIYDMHRYGRLTLDYPSLAYSTSLLNLNSSRVSNRRVRTYADGNIDTALADIANTGASGTLAPSTDNNARLADAIDRLIAQGVKAHINMYGKDELYDSMQKANKFMKGRG